MLQIFMKKHFSKGEIEVLVEKICFFQALTFNDCR